MRLPWLQVNADGLTRARAFGRLYEIGEDAGVGVVLRLWAWALEMAPDGDFSGVITDERSLAAGCGLNPADARRACTELQRVGLVATSPTLRVRGLDRYARAWAKCRKPHGARRKPGANPAETGENPAQTRQKPARKTETETEIEIKKIPLFLSTSSTRADSTQEPSYATAPPRRAPKPTSPKAKKATDPRHAPLLARMGEIYATVHPGQKLAIDGQEAKAVSTLLGWGEPDEVARRWGLALRYDGYRKKVTAISQLARAGEWSFFGLPEANQATKQENDEWPEWGTKRG